MDLDVSISPLVTREFTAVVLAGFGAELIPLTSDYGDEPCPKALLPVANKPMIDYVFAWLELSGIKDVVLICPTVHRHAISNHIHSETSVSLRIDLQTYDEIMDASVGTCSLLRHFAHRIQTDFVVLPCDFLPPPSLSLNTILNKFRSDRISDGAIATTCWFTSNEMEKANEPDDWSPAFPPVAVVWDDKSGTLLHVDTADDRDMNGEELQLRMSLLTLYPRTKVSTKYRDSHVYVCRRTVLDLLQEKPHVDSFREEFIPWLCKVPYQRTRREKYSHVLNPITNAPTQSTALLHSTLYDEPPIPSSNPKDSASDEGSGSPTTPSLRVGVLLHRDQEPAARLNTLHAYFEMNRRLITPDVPTDRSLVDQKAQISTDSMVGPSTQIGERTSVKKSVIGSHCVIGKMVKIVGCVLLDHCVVADGAKLDGCILGKNTKVGAKAELSRCVSQAGYEVNAGESIKNERLEISDWTGVLDEQEDSEETESESDDD
ncbi:UDP-3-O-glucosamine N-acyltransferase [Guyanagaster necrorhizus]|uniref:Translation initiation factor eIF2B subunit gamma n=1 Tax=Guyanagaster necrorhizus TaxID=856835 RepID=A0A9P7VKM6_9AGAR|nr:UDP-3-O-glucosamine N-acyltransferase [Guyanagaster necrorhizus MCA 3950]KAG7441644.1 UDP-3-O-glucosamine N-acyltransferase [Guyanagaster necrorhizus MCA 3950]